MQAKSPPAIAPTSEQLAAADPLHSAWVSAHAGTGKTRILTERFLRLLLAGVKPRSIVCITYTQAAAAQMLDRILATARSWTALSPADLRANLLGLLGRHATDGEIAKARVMFASLLDGYEELRVQTIHSFCQSMLHAFPAEAGLPANFRLLEPVAEKVLLGEARRNLLSRGHGGKGEAVAHALHHFAAMHKDGWLNELLDEIVKHRARYRAMLEVEPALPAWRSRLTKTLRVSDRPFAEKLAEHFTYTDEEASEWRRLIGLLSQSKGVNDRKLAEKLAPWWEMPEARDRLWPQWKFAFLTTAQEPRSHKNWPGADTQRAMQDASAMLIHEQERVLALLDEERALHTLESSMAALVLAEALMGEYAALKQYRGVIDFEDVVARAVGLLRQPDIAQWIMFKLDAAIDHLLVDEAQDTSLGQWQLVVALTSDFFAGEGARKANRTLFVVGDYKQSIYSFQGAAPEAFARMQQAYLEEITNARKTLRQVPLVQSFRSTQAILELVDAVGEPLVASFGEAFRPHSLTRSDHGGRVELWPLVKHEKPTLPPGWQPQLKNHTTPDAAHLLASNIVSKLTEWFAEGRMLGGRHNRAVQPKDVLILVRRRGDLQAAIVAALKRAGIPSVGSDRLLLQDHIAIQDMLAIVEWCLAPYDNLTLATILKCPRWAIREERLLELCTSRGHGSLWNHMQAVASQDEEWKEITRDLADLTHQAQRLAPYEFFYRLLAGQNGAAAWVRRMGQEVEELFDELLNLALQYEASETATLQGFLHWLKDSAAEVKRQSFAGRNEVRVMTVHGAKGLEAPIVILPDTTFKSSKAALFEMMPMEDTTVPIFAASSKKRSASTHALRLESTGETAAELDRLLYVALTRAEDELYIGGVQTQGLETSWYAKISEGMRRLQGVQTLEDGTLLYAPNQQEIVCEQPPTASIGVNEPMAIPAFANSSSAMEEKPFPLIPSRHGVEHVVEYRADHAPAFSRGRERGNAMHRLLQWYGQGEVPEIALMRQAIAPMLETAEADEVAAKAHAILTNPDFRWMFADHARAEVPVYGRVRDEYGQERVVEDSAIDRLVDDGESVWVIDYKNHRQPQRLDTLSQSILTQLQIYVLLVQAAYPGREVRAAILWTHSGEWLEIPAERLSTGALQLLDA